MQRSPVAILSLLALLWSVPVSGMTACAIVTPAATGPPAGCLALKLTRGRQAQYLASQVKALCLVVVGPSGTLRHDYLSPTLQPVSGGADFTFVVSNLVAGTYNATLSAFVDTAETVAAGATTVGPFFVASGQTTNVSAPPLILTATPLGAWTIASTVTVKSIGYQVSQYAYQLTETDGTTDSQSLLTSATSVTRSWGNVVAFPIGVSTTSVTVTAKRAGHPNKTATAIATTSIAADATQSSVLSMKI